MSILTNQSLDISLDGPPVHDPEYDEWCAGAGLTMWNTSRSSAKRRFFMDLPGWERRVDLACIDRETRLAKVLTQEGCGTTERLRALSPE
jgi:hypothetical protein